jgi:hypothetical protein
MGKEFFEQFLIRMSYTVIANAFGHLSSELIVRHIASSKPENKKIIQKSFLLHQSIEGRKELHLGEITGGSEDGEHKRFCESEEMHE